ncbi:sugar phosphate isomerase/epimerase family protein [Taklimakanibacter lacteus]|uniref:sugar phosphate isomerase/epimerase family protein n=1 Tax=Taklimakanibacter lacteus TaxID=2268456 RepID=UPI000E6761E8
MSRLISVSTVVHDGYPLERSFEEIADAGLALVEPAYIRGYIEFDETAFSDMAARRISRAMKQAGVSATAVSAHMDLGEADSTAMLARRVRFAAAIGARYTITNSSPDARRDQFLRAIEANLPAAQALGVVLALENPGHGQDYLIRDGRTGSDVVSLFKSPWLRLNYDGCNVLTCSEGGMRPESDIDSALADIAHIHLKDVRRVPGGWRYTALGEGEIDNHAVIRKLAEADDVPLCIELPLRLYRPAFAGPARDAQAPPLQSLRSAIRKSHDYVLAGLRSRTV